MQNHEFVDEQYYQQNYLEAGLQNYASRSPSLSSQDGVTGSCCSRRSRKQQQANAAPHLQPLKQQHQGLQELSTIHISTRWAAGGAGGGASLSRSSRRVVVKERAAVSGHWACSHWPQYKVFALASLASVPSVRTG